MHKLVGFFGQSGCGKTTLINLFDGRCFNGFTVKVVPNVIRTLLKKNSYYFPNHIETMIQEGKDVTESIYLYLDSQYRLQWDCYSYVNEFVHNNPLNSLIITDRSPLDYLAVTKGAFDYFKNKGYCIDVDKFEELTRYTYPYDMSIDTDLLLASYDSVVVVHPHGNNTGLLDGIRDMFLGSEWSGDNWYDKCNLVDYDRYKHINESSLETRISILDEYLNEITR